ncbi:hypothetical protein SEPCBS119000_006448 [Sporothrix epigloea]|uniref:Importin N-terminal domain-containing protein n=1 Tax=Sporothrix epigloea TaxID=1892477 RepID=A0ABP0E7A1_9PEZI
MAWQPSPDSLKTLIGCLKNSHNGFDKVAQKEAEDMLGQAKTSPDFNKYLAMIFSSSVPPAEVSLSPTDYSMVRMAAGIMIKNAVKTSYALLSDITVAMIKAAVLMGLRDDNYSVRSYAGSIATEVIRRGGIYAWPELLEELLNMIGDVDGQTTPATQEAAISAMRKICEDNAKLLDREHNGQRPLNVILPKLIEASASQLPKVRAQALAALNEFIPRKSQAMLVNIDALLSQLFALASDTNNDVRREVCSAFVALVETRADKLTPHIAGLVDYIISQQKNEEDEDLACQAVKFWLSAGEHEDFWKNIGPYVTKIVPSLLDGMVYSAEDIALYGSASDDDEEEDQDKDIKPKFAGRKPKRNANSADPSSGTSQSNAAGSTYEKISEMDQDELEDGEIEDDFDIGDELGGFDDNDDMGWNVRKGSAAALDVLARDFGDVIFGCIMPYLTENLKHPDWPQREAAVLSLGAIAGGCMTAVTPHLPSLVPYLIALLDDPEPLVRQITCWTLARYSSWAIGLTDAAQIATYFVPMMEGLLTKMLDKNKKVQEAAASAMATLEDKAGVKLEPYAGPIIKQYVRCFEKYKDRNMFILYDCTQTLAEAIGPALAIPNLSDELMPALFKRYESVPDNSREMFPLFECLSYVVMALGSVFAPFAQPVFLRCVKIIHQSLELSLAAARNPQLDEPDKDFLVTSLDLISSIIQALAHDKASMLVAETQPGFFELLSFCLEDPMNEVRQSAYAVLGDCAKFVFPQLKPSLGTILPILLKQLNLDDILDEEIDSGFNVINNACWSVGEISIRHEDGMAPFTDELLKSCVEIMTNPCVPHGVIENAAIALGRLGLACPALLAPHLHTFAEDFLVAMDDINPSEEKATALLGFTLVVTQNPKAMETVLLHYFRTIATYEDIDLRSPVKQKLHDAFQHTISVYCQIVPQLKKFLEQLPAEQQAALQAQYRIF